MSATPLNLNESNDGMTLLNSQPQSQPQPQPQQMQMQMQMQPSVQPPPPQQQNVEYSAEIPKEEKNNNINNKQNTTMDATPLADIMGSPEVMDQPPQMMVAQDPRMMAPVQAPAPAPAAQQQTPQQAKTNPLNLTDEQMQALFVGVCAIIAFSKPVQDKLANFIPQFVTDDGHRSTAGMVVTGLVAALVFYFGQRMVLNK